MSRKPGLRLALCLLAGLPMAACQSEDRQLEGIIVKYGFTRNVPPSTLHGPGLLVAKENYDPREQNPRSVQLATLCTARYSVDLYGFKPTPSETESRDVASQIGGSFSIEAPALKTLFNLSATARAARSAVVTVADARIYTYARDELAEIRALLRPVCRETVRTNIGQGNAHQVVKVLEATIELKINFDASASAAVKTRAVTELTKAGFEIGPVSESLTTRGKALYYGVTLMPVTQI